MSNYADKSTQRQQVFDYAEDFNDVLSNTKSIVNSTLAIIKVLYPRPTDKSCLYRPGMKLKDILTGLIKQGGYSHES